MKWITLLLLGCVAHAQMVVNTGNSRKAGAAAVCTLLSGSTSNWQAWAATSTCAGGSACTNGAGVDTVVDRGSAANNLTQTTSGQRPIYTTGEVNGLATAKWTSTSMRLNATANVTQANTTTTWFAVVRPSSTGAVIIGQGGTTGNLEWRINSSGHQEILKSGVSSIGTGTATFTSGNYYALLATYNQPTGAWAFYVCSSGTCAADGSGTNAVTFTAQVATIGFTSADQANTNQYIAEEAVYLSITTSGFGTYAQCKYGL